MNNRININPDLETTLMHSLTIKSIIKTAKIQHFYSGVTTISQRDGKINKSID